jgi:hypothetical protein
MISLRMFADEASLPDGFRSMPTRFLAGTGIGSPKLGSQYNLNRVGFGM